MEWFDTEIDSIIEIDTKGQRTFRENIDIKNENIREDTFGKNTGTINGELLSLLDNPLNTPVS